MCRESKVHVVYGLKLRVHFSREQREGMIFFLFTTVFFFLLFLKLFYMFFICETTHSFYQQATLFLDITETYSTQRTKPCLPARDASFSL